VLGRIIHPVSNYLNSVTISPICTHIATKASAASAIIPLSSHPSGGGEFSESANPLFRSKP
jgi:hypothetical protein